MKRLLTLLTLAAVLLGSLLVEVEPVAAADRYPCIKSGRYPSLPYACPVVWPSNGKIPVFGQHNNVIDYLYRGSGTQYFRCEAVGARWTRGSYWNTWYAYTQGDGGKWGWVSEVYFKGGNNNEPDAGLPTC